MILARIGLSALLLSGAIQPGLADPSSTAPSGGHDMREDDPDGLRFVAAGLALLNEQLERAQQLSEEAVEMSADGSADRADRLDALAWIYHIRGRDADAAAADERAIRLHGGDPGFHVHRGEIYAAQGRDADARVEWRRALVLPPIPGARGIDRAAIEARLKGSN